MTHEPDPCPGETGGPVDWEARYSAADQVWSGNPNGVLVAEITGITPGTAADVGCGEGADAIWLAEQGWQVTAFDISSVALGRAADHIANTGVTLKLVHGGLLDPALAGATFDLVNAQYPALLHEAGRSLAGLLDLVAPGGTLLFVHHADVGGDHARAAGYDPDDYVMPHDVRAALVDRAAEWQLVVDDERPRHVTTGAGAAHTTDVVLKARRKP